MKKLSDVTAQSLIWIQSEAVRNEFELRIGNEIAAILRWENFFGSLVSIQTEDSKWSIRRSGFLWRRMTMLREGGTSGDAEFRSGWFGRGVLDVQGGDFFRWRCTRCLPWEWTFSNASDFPVVRFRSCLAGFKSLGEIELAENATLHRNQLPLLILAGWYLVLVIQRLGRRRS
jgi:hypothetical protein